MGGRNGGERWWLQQVNLALYSPSLIPHLTFVWLETVGPGPAHTRTHTRTHTPTVSESQQRKEREGDSPSCSEHTEPVFQFDCFGSWWRPCAPAEERQCWLGTTREEREKGSINDTHRGGTRQSIHQTGGISPSSALLLLSLHFSTAYIALCLRICIA